MKRLLRITLGSLAVTCLLPATIAWAQVQGGLPGGGRAPASSGVQPMPDGLRRPVFISGSVRLTDGTVPPEHVLIERVCNGQSKPEGYTDSQGNFSFLVSEQGNIVLGDASTGTLPGAGVDSTSNRIGAPIPRDLTGCEIEGRLVGYQSSTLVLTSRSTLDNTNIGIIHLRRVTGNEALTVNTTTASAPRDARNAYEKGLDNAKKKKWSDAEQDFLKAVRVYPRYAVAWYELGRVYRQQNKLEDAIRVQTEAAKIDPEFVNAWAELTVLAAVQSKWDEVALDSSKVLELDPNSPSDIYFYSAVAHYNLKRIDTAEEHARHAATLDPQHRNPRINHLLGVILVQTREYAEATENLKLYLKLTPNAPETAAINQMLDEIGKASEAR